MKMLSALMLALVLCTLCAAGAWAAEQTIVEDGTPLAIIAIHPDADEIAREAADDLQTHIRMASGAEMPIIEATDVGALPADKIHLVVGSGLAEQLGIDAAELEPEEYVVETVERNIVFVGHDLGRDGNPASKVRKSTATVWAVGWFLDHQMGVRWLWPGEGGTYVPEQRTIVAPDLHVREQPTLQQRKLRTQVHGEPSQENCRLLTDEQRAQIVAETTRWKHRHQMGSRSTFGFGHAFGQWWEDYSEEHPDWFAKPPAGMEPRTGNRTKLCVSNPEVAAQIIEEWQAAGSPDNWNVCPNDGSQFCTCDNCRAMDSPPDQDPEAIWTNGGDLSARFLTFWNSLITTMRETNQNATISSYAYSCYRNAPPGMTVNDGIVLGIVHTYHAYDEWQAWSDAGAKLFLRPNWWHTGGPAPHIPLHVQGEYFLFAREHSMIGFDFDSMLGFWGTQGPLYYVIARLATRDGLTVDDAIDEYCSAFGSATPAVKEYLAYWEDFANRAAYAVAAGGVVSVNPDGLYEQTCRKYEMNIHPIASSWPILPALYDDEVLGAAEAILERAEAAVAEDGPDFQARVQFLRDGFDHLRLTRDTVALSDPRFRPEGATEEDFRASAEALQEMRADVTLRHVLWGEATNNYEVRKRAGTGLTAAGWVETEGL